jgi:hypothetical protein
MIYMQWYDIHAVVFFTDQLCELRTDNLCACFQYPDMRMFQVDTLISGNVLTL